MDLTIYHNPRCSKSRQTLEILQSKGLEPKVIEYLRQPPGAEQVAQLLAATGLRPAELLRDNEPEYRELGLAGRDLDAAELTRLLQQHPKLLQRPIVIAGDKGVVARPPERVEEILPQ